MSLPETWRLVRVKDIVLDTQPGFAQRPDQDEGALPQIRTHNVSPDGQINMAGIKSVSASDSDIAKYALQPNDIVFNNTNSEEWIGKTALFEATGTYLFSNHMTRLRANREFVEPAYLARYLHFLWKIGFTKQRAKRWVSQAAVDQRTLREFKVVMPTLLEQQRIVAILSEADQLLWQRRKVIKEAQELASKQFQSLFGEPNPKRNRRWPTAKLGDKVTVETGGTPSRHADGLYGGDINWVKSTELIDGEIEETEEKLTEAGLASSNAKLFPPNTILLAMYGQGQTRGRTAKLLKPASCNQACAALLAGEDILPDYLWFWLQTSYEDVRAFGRGGQQANLNLSIVRGLVIPVPPIDLQRKFSDAVTDIRKSVADLQANKVELETLASHIVSTAFSGQLTERWRTYHRRELEAAARERDRKLAGQVKVTITEHAPEERSIPALPDRAWLFTQLSEIQRSVWQALTYEKRASLIPSEEGALTEFRQRCFQIKHLENADDRILRALEQLAGLGLVAKVSVRNEEGDYVTAFRPLRDEERSRGDDMTILGGPRN